jgi:predicted HicB family RNase H-like nuclease
MDISDMGYNGYTDKKKESNKRYMDKLQRISLWLTPKEKQIIEEKAAASGKSVNKYIKDLLL